MAEANDGQVGLLGSSPSFVHLRVHSAYSLLEGALPLKKILAKAAGDNQPAIAITDTNNLFIALEFAQKAIDDGIQPIIGCQVSIDMEDAVEGGLKHLQIRTDLRLPGDAARLPPRREAFVLVGDIVFDQVLPVEAGQERAGRELGPLRRVRPAAGLRRGG